MISARVQTHSSLVARLAGAAEKLALAKGEEKLREGRSDGSRWRKPGLLWPLFNGGD